MKLDDVLVHFRLSGKFLGCSFCGAVDWAWWIRPMATRSPDVSSIDYVLCGHLKAIIHETPVDLIEDLVAPLSNKAASVREMPGIFHAHCAGMYHPAQFVS